MTDRVLEVLESTRAYLLKRLAMMSTGTMTTHIEGKDGTKQSIEADHIAVAEIEQAIYRHHQIKGSAS